MAASGFEGFEKRLELHFSDNTDHPRGLRQLSLAAIEQVLRAVQCTIVSAASNHSFDAYVLSESSLFVYPNRIIIKTCGTTQLLRSVRILLRHAAAIGLVPTRCRYTRGAFLFPDAQPFPHTSFGNEVLYLEERLPANLCYRKACVLPSNVANHTWHVYSASDSSVLDPSPGLLTLEVCMTELDRTVAGKFYRCPGDGKSNHEAGKEMTEAVGIGSIVPEILICDHAFDPCGYSMNGLGQKGYTTIHVTPEDGFSYASFECTASNEMDIHDVLRRVAAVFRPGTMSVSVTTDDGGCLLDLKMMEKVGLKCCSRAEEEFPSAGTVTYYAFVAGRKQ